LRADRLSQQGSCCSDSSTLGFAAWEVEEIIEAEGGDAAAAGAPGDDIKSCSPTDLASSEITLCVIKICPA
jgi:hypothetical protein